MSTWRRASLRSLYSSITACNYVFYTVMKTFQNYSLSNFQIIYIIGFPGSSIAKNLLATAGDVGSWVGKIPWRRERLPTPGFLPGESHGQRSLVGYSPWGHKESDMTERLRTTEHIINHSHHIVHYIPGLIYLISGSLVSFIIPLAASVLYNNKNKI